MTTNAAPPAPIGSGPGDMMLTYRDVANILGISLPTVYRLVRRGELPVTRPSQHTSRVSSAALRAYVAGHTANRAETGVKPP